MSRHVSADDMKAQKEKFKISEVKKVIVGFDAKLAQLFQAFYDRSIDFGAHPNPHAITSASEFGQEGSDSTILTLALSMEPKMLLHAMKFASRPDGTVHLPAHLQSQVRVAGNQCRDERAEERKPLAADRVAAGAIFRPN
jgi:hypothetical protein